MNRKSLTREMVEQKAVGASYADIGQAFGVSRQRIQQYFVPPLLIQELVADRAKALCEICGNFDQWGHFHHKVYEFDILNTPENILYLCQGCHISMNGEPHFCKNCGKRISSFRRYCSPKCREDYYSINCECSNCHRIFSMNARQKIRIRKSESGLLFCSKKCQGSYIAEHFGFGSHPENIKKNLLKKCSKIKVD